MGVKREGLTWARVWDMKISVSKKNAIRALI
jgi:hypothetical protein